MRRGLRDVQFISIACMVILMNITGVRLNCTCDKAMQVTENTLHRHGFEVTRNFDLCDALQSLGMSYPCTHHQSGQCSCNYVVLSVYAPAESTDIFQHAHQILLRGHRDSTWLSLPSLGITEFSATETGVDMRLVRALADALYEL